MGHLKWVMNGLDWLDYGLTPIFSHAIFIIKKKNCIVFVFFVTTNKRINKKILKIWKLNNA